MYAKQIAVVCLCLLALLAGGGCSRRSEVKPTGNNRRSTRAPRGRVYRSDRVPNFVETFGEVSDLQSLTVYSGSQIPKSVMTWDGTMVDVPTRVADENAIQAWAKHFPHATYFRGSIRDDPSESFIMVAYIWSSGITSWAVHLFTGHEGKEWRNTTMISGLEFRDSRTAISSVEMPDADTLILKDQRGNQLARFKLQLQQKRK